MNTGVVVGAYYIGKFCLFPLSFSSAFSGLLFIGLTLLVPYLIYRLVRTYRDRCLDGHIEFVQALVYAMLIMTFGSILAAAAHYIYFAFIDGGRMVGALEQSIEQFSAIDLSTLGTAGNDSSIIPCRAKKDKRQTNSKGKNYGTYNRTTECQCRHRRADG